MDRDFDYSTVIREAESIDEAFDVVREFGESRGMPYFMFTNIGTHDSPMAFKVNYLKTNYPEAWLDVYRENMYFYSDPVAQAIFSNQMPFFWSEHLKQCADSLTEENLAMMHHATEHGLMDGMGASYLKNKGHLCTFSMASPKPFETYDYRLLAEAYLIGAALTHAHHNLMTEEDNFEALSKREREIVNLAALGKTDNEIAQISSISINTVRYHWKKVFEKLNSYSRIYAIVKAMNLGYVDPYSLEVTTESGSIETYKKSV